MSVMERIGRAGLIPVVVVGDAAEAVPAAGALLSAGLDVMEITMRTPAGPEAIRQVRQRHPGMLVGAGTVLRVETARQTVEAGASFVVSPGLNPAVAQWCIERQIPVMPGCVTPTEIEAALALGLRTLKFFPASVYGGVQALAALYGPYRAEGIRFVPTGGVHGGNLAEYVDKPYVHAVGGGWLCSPEDLRDRNVDAVARSVDHAVGVLLGLGVCRVSPDEAPGVQERLARWLGIPVSGPGESPGGGVPPGDMPEGTVLGTHSVSRTLAYLGTRKVPVRVGSGPDGVVSLEHVSQGYRIWLVPWKEGMP